MTDDYTLGILNYKYNKIEQDLWILIGLGK